MAEHSRLQRPAPAAVAKAGPAATRDARHEALERRPQAKAERDHRGLLAGRNADAPQALPLEAPAANRTGLPDRLKAGVESLSGVSLDGVKVHYNSSKPAGVGALAYAQGSDIHVAAGQEKHLPHEAWHVVQQAQGRVRPQRQLKGVAVNDDPGLEHEADRMGAKAAADGAASPARRSGIERAAPPAAGGPMQRVLTRNADGSVIDDFDLDTISYHEAVYIHEQVVQMRVWHADPADLVKIQAAMGAGPPVYGKGPKDDKSLSSKAKKDSKAEKVEKAFVPTTKSEIFKEKQIGEYLALIDHLAGEGGGKTALTGGHLLAEMKTKYENLRLSGAPDDNAPWEGWWSDGTAEPKWSSFFPATWTKKTLTEKLRSSSSIKGGLELPGNIVVSKTGDTFYPWKNQTLGKPALKDMKPVAPDKAKKK